MCILKVAMSCWLFMKPTTINNTLIINPPLMICTWSFNQVYIGCGLFVNYTLMLFSGINKQHVGATDENKTPA